MNAKKTTMTSSPRRLTSPRRTPARRKASKRKPADAIVIPGGGERLMPAPRPPLSPAYGIVEPLTELLRWARLTLHDRIVSNTGERTDRSAVVILDTMHHYGPMRMSELASRVGLDRSTISRQVSAVVKAGLVVRTDDRADARAALLSLSMTGQAVRQRIAHNWHAIAMELISDWSYDEQVEFGRLLSKLAHRLREEVSL